jgi:hypothetical protein
VHAIFWERNMIKYPPVRDRRNVGKVVLPIEKLTAARELSSCCVGVEAALEVDGPDLTRNERSTSSRMGSA